MHSRRFRVTDLGTLKDESGQMHSRLPRYRRHNYIYLLRFKVPTELIIIVFIKPMGTAISGLWDLRDTRTLRDYDALVQSLVWQRDCTAHTLPGAVPVAHWMWAVRPDSPAKPTLKNVTFSPAGYARLPIWLHPLTANNHLYVRRQLKTHPLSIKGVKSTTSDICL